MKKRRREAHKDIERDKERRKEIRVKISRSVRDRERKLETEGRNVTRKTL